MDHRKDNENSNEINYRNLKNVSMLATMPGAGVQNTMRATILGPLLLLLLLKTKACLSMAHN